MYCDASASAQIVWLQPESQNPVGGSSLPEGVMYIWLRNIGRPKIVWHPIE
jgi:hypothetical protein